MKTSLAIALLTIFTQCVFAAPPDLECLSDLSFNDAYSSTVMVRLNSPIVILIGDTPDTDSDPTETWAIWNEPLVLKFLKGRKLVVTYLDEDTPDQPYLELFMPESRPMVIYRDGRGRQYRRSMNDLADSPEGLIDWLEHPGRESAEHKINELKLLRRIANYPDDPRWRLELIKEYHRVGNAYGADRLFVWLFKHNDLWKKYEVQRQKGKLDEDGFKRILFAEISRIRDQHHLFTSPVQLSWFDEVETYEFDDWVTREQWKMRQFTFTNGIGIDATMQWKMLPVAEELIARRENNTATDRDLFILKALTAEGEGWEALVKEYSNSAP